MAPDKDTFDRGEAQRRLEDAINRIRRFRDNLDRLVVDYSGRSPDSESRQEHIQSDIRNRLYDIEEEMIRFRKSFH